MGDVAAAAAPAKAPKKAIKTKKPKTAASHPPVAQMVNDAIKNLKDRKGTSLAAIKKYIAANYKCDIVRLSPFIRKYLKKSVTDGKLVQVKGTGAAGSFKLKAGEKDDKPKAKKTKKPKATKTTKPTAAKKPKTPKKAKKPKAVKPKSAKKATKPKVKKPKAVTPKKAKKSPAKKSARKAAAKK